MIPDGSYHTTGLIDDLKITPDPNTHHLKTVEDTAPMLVSSRQLQWAVADKTKHGYFSYCLLLLLTANYPSPMTHRGGSGRRRVQGENESIFSASNTTMPSRSPSSVPTGA
jgi:hypothetical protein